MNELYTFNMERFLFVNNEGVWESICHYGSFFIMTHHQHFVDFPTHTLLYDEHQVYTLNTSISATSIRLPLYEDNEQNKQRWLGTNQHHAMLYLKQIRSVILLNEHYNVPPRFIVGPRGYQSPVPRVVSTYDPGFSDDDEDEDDEDKNDNDDDHSSSDSEEHPSNALSFAQAGFILESITNHVTYARKRDEQRFAQTAYLYESIKHQMTWNSYRFYYGDNERSDHDHDHPRHLVVDITLGYDRNRYMTMDASLFMKHRLYEYDLFWFDNRVCFACDWEYAEDHPEAPFKQWTTYDHYDADTGEWMYDIPSHKYNTHVESFGHYLATMCRRRAELNRSGLSDDDPTDLETPPPQPDLRLFTWIQLHCLLLQITYSKFTRTKVSYADSDTKNLRLTNLYKVNTPYVSASNKHAVEGTCTIIYQPRKNTHKRNHTNITSCYTILKDDSPQAFVFPSMKPLERPPPRHSERLYLTQGNSRGLRKWEKYRKQLAMHVFHYRCKRIQARIKAILTCVEQYQPRSTDYSNGVMVTFKWPPPSIPGAGAVVARVSSSSSLSS